MDSSYLRRATSDCIPPTPTNTLTSHLNNLLNSSGPGYILSLCPGQTYPITAPLLFTAANQEISTAGYPTGSDRAILLVNGPPLNHSTAVAGNCANCDGVKFRNVQIHGQRLGKPPIDGGANIEMGGPNSNQLVEFVNSTDPRGWSCLHIAEGSLNCVNATVQNNDIGPAGSDLFQQWADGISFACQNGLIRNNMIYNPTDGGIVLFGAPGTRVENNTIWIQTNTLLGGINLVDYNPWSGNYSGVVVTNNSIFGGFADGPPGSQIKGPNTEDVIIKVGIALGPRVWFGDKFKNNVSLGATIENNFFSGAFSFAIGMSSTKNFMVQNNVLVGNTSFIGGRGPNCTDNIPAPNPFVFAPNTTSQSVTQANFVQVPDGDNLICVFPPASGNFWPYGSSPSPPEGSSTTSPSAGSGSGSGKSNAGTTAGIVLGAIAAVIFIAVAAWYIRKWALKRQSQTAYTKFRN